MPGVIRRQARIGGYERRDRRKIMIDRETWDRAKKAATRKRVSLSAWIVGLMRAALGLDEVGS